MPSRPRFKQGGKNDRTEAREAFQRTEARAQVEREPASGQKGRRGLLWQQHDHDLARGGWRQQACQHPRQCPHGHAQERRQQVQERDRRYGGQVPGNGPGRTQAHPGEAPSTRDEARTRARSGLIKITPTLFWGPAKSPWPLFF